MSLDKQTLLPCPKCQSTNVNCCEVMTDKPFREWCAANCDDCNFDGPEFDFDREADGEFQANRDAIKAWNELPRPIPTTRTQEVTRSAEVENVFKEMERWNHLWPAQQKILSDYIAKLEASPSKPQQSDEGLREALNIALQGLLDADQAMALKQDKRREVMAAYSSASALSQASAPVPTSGAVEVRTDEPVVMRHLDLAVPSYWVGYDKARKEWHIYRDGFADPIEWLSGELFDFAEAIRTLSAPPAADGKLREALRIDENAVQTIASELERLCIELDWGSKKSFVAVVKKVLAPYIICLSDNQKLAVTLAKKIMGKQHEFIKRGYPETVLLAETLLAALAQPASGGGAI